jgi:hypothetical protein
MSYSTLGFITSLKLRRRYIFINEFVDPINSATYGWIFQCGPIAVMKITGWKGEQITVVKIFEREIVW